MEIARRFLLGRYLPGTSLVHRIDGRIKILILILISVSIFLAPGPEYLLIPLWVFGILLVLSGVKFSVIFKGVIPILWIALFTAVVHLNDPARVALMSGRIVILFLWATLLTSTTAVADLASAAGWFLRPFRFAGVSPEKTALTLSIALRFFPLILNEAESIIKAQKIRAEKYTLRKRLESFSVAFIIRLLKKARSVDDALKNRRLLENGHFKAAGMKPFSAVDYIALAAGILIAVSTVVLI